MIFSIDQKKELQIALYTAEREISYGELAGAVRGFGTQLTGRKLVFCFCENSAAAVVGYLGILEQASVPLLLDPRMNREQLMALYEIYRPQLFWISGEQASEWRRERGGEILYRYEDYVLLDTGEPVREELHPQLALLLTTSGSTGSPKLVRLSRQNIQSNAASICQYLRIREDERAITSLPMYYTYGLSVIHSHLLAGASVILTEASILQEQFWQLFSQRRATSLAGVPYTYQMLDRLHFFDRPCHTLRTMTQAGGKLSEELQRKAALWARDQQVRFFIMYGQTEATARMGYLPEDRSLEKPGSLGIAIPGGRFWLEDEAHQPVHEPGRTGELYYQGPNVSLGYARCREDLARGDDWGGVLATGDLAQFDSEGYFYIVGRKSRFLKLYGRRISLDACEKMLESAWGQRDAEFACTGDDSGLHVVCTSAELLDEVCQWLSEQLNLSRRAVFGTWMSRIPRTSQGKKNYAAIEENERNNYTAVAGNGKRESEDGNTGA